MVWWTGYGRVVIWSFIKRRSFPRWRNFSWLRRLYDYEGNRIFLEKTYPFLTSRYFLKDYWPRSVKLKISWIVLFQAKFNNQPNSKCSRFFAERVVSFKWHTTLKKDHKLNRCSEKTFGSFDTFNIYQALKSVASLPERKKNSQLI